MLFNKKNSLLTVGALMLTACTLKAAETSSAGNDGYNTTLISLVSLILILLFVIGVLAGTLRQLTFVTREKMYKDKKDKNNTLKTLLLFVVTTFSALAATAADVVEVAPAPAIQSIDGIPIEEFYVIITVIALELLVIGALMIFINVLLRIIRNTPEREQKALEMAKKSWFWDNFNTAAVPLKFRRRRAMIKISSFIYCCTPVGIHYHGRSAPPSPSSLDAADATDAV